MYLEYDVDSEMFDLVFPYYDTGYIRSFTMEQLKQLRDMITALLGDEI